MQKLRSRSYAIDLNGPRARANLRVLALLYPFWGLVLPISAFTERYCGISTLPLFSWQKLFLLGLYCTLILLCAAIFSNRLVLSSKKIRHGYNFFGGKKIENLARVELTRSPLSTEESVLAFRFKDGTDKTVFIETAGMESRMKARLIAAVDNLAPDCQITLAARAALSRTDNSPLMLIHANRDQQTSANAVIKLPYQSHPLMTSAKEAFGQYQGLFWRVWCLVLLPVTIYQLPILFQSLFYPPELLDFGDISNAPYIGQWKSLWTWTLPFMNIVSDGTQIVFTITSTIWAKYLLATAAIVLAILAGHNLLTPNRLEIDNRRLRLRLHMLGTATTTAEILWPHVKQISVNKDNQPDPNKWTIKFSADDGNEMKIQLGAIGGLHSRNQLLTAIEKYAAQAAIDAELGTILAPVAEVSYTDLWLTSLGTPPQREKLTPLKEGQILQDGRYIIKKMIGSGGQGLAYLAEARLPGESATGEVVIKETMLPVYAEAAKKKSLEAFEKAVRLLKSLHHAGIAALRDYFIEDHRAYLVLDKAEGINLRQHVQAHGPLPPEAVLAIARQMAVILTYLHEQEPPVVHRDFTPENIMLSEDGSIKLIDFGVAQELKNHTSASVVGKHAYLPPEQFRGQACPQSDIYALAASLYFLLTGSDPEPLTCLHLLDSVLYEGTSDKVALALDRAIKHGSEQEIEKRTKNAADFLDELTERSVTANG
jgi:tRNA A-37 threonylcarbamoyl transferase component Bud32